jgi:hypothetical protein
MPGVKKRVKPVIGQTIRNTDFLAKKSIASLARLSPVHVSEAPPLHQTVHWDMVVDHIGKHAARSRDGRIARSDVSQNPPDRQ